MANVRETPEEQARRLVEEVIAGWLEVIGLSPRAGVRRKFYGGVHTADLAQRLVRRLVPVFERAEYTDDRLADADANVSRVRKAALHEMNELRARLERAEAERDAYKADAEAWFNRRRDDAKFYDDLDKIEWKQRAAKAETTVARLRAAAIKADDMLRRFWHADDPDAIRLCEVGDVLRAALAATEEKA